MKNVYCQDDRISIPNFIMNMTVEEIDAFIAEKKKKLNLSNKQEDEGKSITA